MQPPCNISQPPHRSARSLLLRRPRPSSATFNSHRPTASAANASGFLLTVLSKARHNIVATPSHSRMRASDKTLASSVHKSGASTNLLTKHDLAFLRLSGYAKSLQNYRGYNDAHECRNGLSDQHHLGAPPIVDPTRRHSHVKLANIAQRSVGHADTELLCKCADNKYALHMRRERQCDAGGRHERAGSQIHDAPVR